MSPFYPYVVDRRAWTGGELPDKEDWVVRLPLPAVHRLMERAGALAQTGGRIDAFEPRRFFDAELAAGLAAPFAEVRDGRGFAVLRGFPVESAPLESLKFALWELGARLAGGQRRGEFADLTSVTDEPARRAGHGGGAERLCFHTNACDMIALMAVRSARRGGESSVASAFAVHNLFLRERPDLLPALYRGARSHRRGVLASGDPFAAPRRIPVFSVAGRALSVRYAPPFVAVELEADDGDSTLVEAMDALERYGERVKATFRLEPGEVLLLNNLTTLHARSRFEDWYESERKRLLLRLTLNVKGFRPIDRRLYSSSVRDRDFPFGERAPLRESAA